MEVSTKYAYFEGKIVPFAEAKISVMTHALHFGTGAFAGIRAYWSEDADQLYLFRPLDHFRRFLNSTKLLCMEFDHTPESLLQTTLDLVRMEGWREDAYIRPLAYIAETLAIGPTLHGLHPEITIFSIPFGGYVPNEEGTRITISSWTRVDDNIIPARGKITGSYVNSSFIKNDALRSGFDEALVLNQQGHVSEGSGENFFMVKNGVLVTPPVTEDILEGITRRTIIELAGAELGITVVERPIDRSEVYLADEAFFSGTAVQIAAITHVDHRPIGSGRMGPVVSQLREVFFSVVRGRVEKYLAWNTPVYEQASS